MKVQSLICLVSVFVTIAFSVASPLQAADSALVCIDDRPFIRKAHFERGCWPGIEPFYSSLLLKSETVHGGTVDFKVDWTLGYADPQCDNPRGQIVIYHLPLPVFGGVWEISEEGETLGFVSFRNTLPCRIKGDGPVLD